jgi:hypothetical protein
MALLFKFSRGEVTEKTSGKHGRRLYDKGIKQKRKC